MEETTKIKENNYENKINENNENQSNNLKTRTSKKGTRDTAHSWASVKHVWWVDALLFIGGTILLGLIAKLLGGEMGSFGGEPYIFCVPVIDISAILC